MFLFLSNLFLSKISDIIKISCKKKMINQIASMFQSAGVKAYLYFVHLSFRFKVDLAV